MNARWKKGVFAACFAMIACGLAWGQPQGPPPQGPPREQGDQRPDPLEDPGRAVEMVRMYAMTEALGLSEEQCAKIFPLMAQSNRERRGLTEDKEILFAELRRMVEDPNLVEAELLPKMKAFEEVSNRRREMDLQLIEASKPHLSVRQQVQLLLFQGEFDRRLRDIIGRAREEGPQANLDRPEKQKKMRGGTREAGPDRPPAQP